ncbi:hypothetical protein Cylst_2881 [Cylindrospermum stagnale PCC 7417]|uniref:CHAT domain-containing protein n=1 Tax=Cylindrospermum stagnale PCC 7417 TaxID=56107 RepID=K9WZ43_9NOST|nr:CHAT domain-containing protein [Cylindrospermum stagnale]AFZ25074.1 hypothetical protein Cylst_2881 [Cylindrospermum stagnale PCC 7417]
MNEQRQQAYHQLIKELLSCPNVEEPGILQAHQDLLDAGFLPTLEAVAEYFAQQGNENNAGWLRNLATQLRGELNLETTAPDLQAYGQLLLEVLQATAENNGDAQVVYPLLAANTDKLNDIFAEILRLWATNTLAEAEPETAASIAGLIVNFSNLIQQFPLGNKASNMEIAISGYEIALTVFTRPDFPQDWAATQNNLGNAYLYRIRGDKAENLEKAIAAYIDALQIYTRADFPQDWATLQNNLGNAYSDRIRGDKAENLEMAIAAYTAALQIYTHADFPQNWATLQNNLGTANLYRIRGDKAENLEMAIAAYSSALQVLTRADFPQNWATTQSNLGTAYSQIIRGDKAENLDQAIAAYSAALEVYTRPDFPQDWAGTQNNLGNAYLYRIRGDKAENLENAIAAYTAALQVLTRANFPQDWATLQNNLGNSYRDRIRGDKAENLDQAITAYTAALQVRTRADFPQNWATTQNNLGNSYRDRIRGDKAENLEKAIAAYSAALQVRTRADFPQYHVETSVDLAILYQESGHLISAYITLESVVSDTGLILSRDKWDKIYFSIIEVCLKLNEYTLAIEYIEFSENQTLLENIRHKVELDIETEKSELIKKERSSEKHDINLKTLKNLRQQREQLTRISIGSLPITFNEIQNLLDNETAIIQFYIFNDCFRAFIITRTNDKPEIWQSATEDLEKLKNWIDIYLDLYDKNKDQWVEKLNNQLTELGQILHLEQIISLVPPRCQKLILIPHRRLHLLPLHALPLAQQKYLFDKFPNGVSYAPSCQLLRHAQNQAQNLEPSPIAGTIGVGFQAELSNLFAIQNPTNDLTFTDIEVETIAALFQPHEILKSSQASKAALAEAPTKDNFHNAQWLHFACHGYFDFKSPLNSGLQLANAEVSHILANTTSSRYLRVSNETTVDLTQCLTLEDIFKIKLPNCRLVCLSACETGLIDFSNTSDEYIGLPSGFLYAGSPSIVSTLWRVNDLSTAFLMIKFYQHLQAAFTKGEDVSVAVALNQAQIWLRDVTRKELEEWINELSLDSTWQAKILRLLSNTATGDQPFQSPDHWAAFTAIGK